MKNLFCFFAALFLLYVYLHNPVLSFTGFGMIKFMYLLLPFVLLPEVQRMVRLHQGVWYSFIAVFIYCIFRTVIGGNSAFIYTALVACIECFFLPIILIYFIKKWNVNVVDVLFVVGAISCIITILCLFVPSFQSFIRSLMIEYEIFDKMKYRGFGFSEGLTYAYGIILGLLAGFSFPYLARKKWFIPFLPLLALAVLVNARTGMVVFLGCLAIFFLMNFKMGFRLFVSLCVIVFALSFVEIDFADDYTVVFIQEFFYELGDFFMGTDNASYSTADVLLKKHIVLPNGIDWVFGSGQSIYLAQKNSDVGYILQLNYGGIVYMLLMGILLYQFLRLIDNKYLLLILLFTFGIANLKGPFIPNSGGFRLFVLLCFIYSKNNPLRVASIIPGKEKTVRVKM